MFDLAGNPTPGFSVLSAIYHATVQNAPAKDVRAKPRKPTTRRKPLARHASL
jgi:hypothetical protein